MDKNDPTYTAVTMEQHPLTGEAVPRTKLITPETSVGELLNWVKRAGPRGEPNNCPVADIRIVQNT